jgi:hypothetical protein
MARWVGKGKEKQRRNNRSDRMNATNPWGWALAAAEDLRGNHGCTLEQRNQNEKRETASEENGEKRVGKRPELQVLMAEPATPFRELPDLRGWNQGLGGMAP